MVPEGLVSVFKARQTIGAGGSPTIDQNFADIETTIKAVQKAAGTPPAVTSVTQDHAASVNDSNIFMSKTGTVTLADAAKLKGRTIIVKNTGSGTVTVAGSQSQSVDSGGSISLAAGVGKKLVSDGENWWSV